MDPERNEQTKMCWVDIFGNDQQVGRGVDNNSPDSSVFLFQRFLVNFGKLVSFFFLSIHNSEGTPKFDDAICFV